MRLRSARDRTHDEFERFVVDVGERLLRTAYLVVWDVGEAEDLVQECLVQVARRWPRVRGMDQPVAYARQILFHLALDGAVRRTRQREALAVASDAHQDHEDPSAAAPPHLKPFARAAPAATPHQ